jgi:hypothetical protein
LSSSESNQSRAKKVFSVVARLVPGYKSYAEKESLRDNDSLLRKQSENNLREVRGALEQLKSKALAKGEFEAISEITRVSDRCLVLENICQSAVRGYASVFQEIEVDELLLQNILEADKRLAETMEALKSSMREDLNKDSLEMIKRSLEHCNEMLNERSELLRGI